MPDGDIWAGMEMGGVTQYHGGRFRTYTTQDGLPSNDVRGISGDDRGNVWVLAHGLVTQWDAPNRRFVVVSPQEERYSDSLTWDARAGFWRIDEAGLHLFVRGQKSHYALPSGWRSGSMRPEAGLDVNNHIWVSSATGQVVRLIDGHLSNVPGSRKEMRPDSVQTAFTTDYRDSHGNVWPSGVEWQPGVQNVQYVYHRGHNPQGSHSTRFLRP
jgi:hypothetical protein